MSARKPVTITLHPRFTAEELEDARDENAAVRHRLANNWLTDDVDYEMREEFERALLVGKDLLGHCDYLTRAADDNAVQLLRVQAERDRLAARVLVLETEKRALERKLAEAAPETATPKEVKVRGRHFTYSLYTSLLLYNSLHRLPPPFHPARLPAYPFARRGSICMSGGRRYRGNWGERS
jgi:hypothetical protein